MGAVSRSSKSCICQTLSQNAVGVIIDRYIQGNDAVFPSVSVEIKVA